MVKYKFPGKPSKISQRSLISAYTVTVPSNDTSAISEAVCYGLSIFDNTFESGDEIPSFNGFSFFEIQNSFNKREKYSTEIQDKFSQRGLFYQPSFYLETCSVITVSDGESSLSKFPHPSVMQSKNEFVSLINKSERRKRGKIWIRNKKTINRYHTKIQARHTFKGLNKSSLLRFKHKPSSNYLSEKYCRKFVLPCRSLHSSRVIKPNKRFIDTEKNSKTRTLNNDKPNSTDTNIIINNVKKSADVAIPSNKVIIREARLNITTEATIAGPFSVKKNVSFDKDKFRSGVIACGVCGLVRYYKHVFQTKKFGIYSCEQCRRFIVKMIKQSKMPHYEIIRCRNENGVGKCVISSTSLKQKESGDNYSPSKSLHCPACWLILCLQRYLIPNTIRKLLVRLIPEDLKVFPSNMVSIDMKKSLHNESDHSFTTAAHKIEDINDTLKKRLRKNYYIKTISSNKRALEKNEINASVKSRYFPFKRNTSNQRINAKSKSIHENAHKENNDKDFPNARGPRIKHVCRSASSVLKTSLVALNVDEVEGPLCNSSEPDTTPINKEDAKIESQNQLNKVRHCDEAIDMNPACREFTTQQYGARSLQDFCKESPEESDENEEKLISIDFWEAYDPDEIFKTGFPLISSEPVNVRALCFLCGSTGLEKLLYCVCCCEPYHWFCAEGPSAFREEAELEKCRVNWVCRKCKVCSTCGEGGLRLLISCQLCRNSYHPECLSSKALNKRIFKSDRPWVCPTCLKCKSCNESSVFMYVGNVPLCLQCFKLRQKGNYCPLCQGCYQDEDYNVQMMECGICKCWIHAKCEGISYEKYQILSFLPETIEFVCRLCCTVPPAPWWLAVEDELKARCLGILKYLCKNKQIGNLFKESPKKDSACKCLRRQICKDNENVMAITSNKESESVTNISPIRQLSMDEPSEISVNNMNVNKCKYGSDEYYNPEWCSVCNNNAKMRKKTNQRLLMIKGNVHNNLYSSISVFHQELEHVIKEIEEQNLFHSYREILKKFFPWFEPERACNEQIQEHVVETHSSDCIASSDLIEDCHSSEDDYIGLQKLLAQDEYRYENFRILDVRTCNLCKSLGEAIPSEGGRLIYCGRNEWVHSNCALWSSEVFEEIDGSLQNVHSAISRGRQIRCSACEKKGASVGCCFKNCGVTYHFFCAKKAHCKFFQNKTIYCNNHEVPDVTLPLLTNEKDFEILRPVYVELDRKKKKLECHTNVKVHIGSLHIESLGKIDPHLSDDPKHIIPVYFRCTRLYWSTSKPWKIIQYQIQIKVSYSFQQCSTGETDINYTVDHSKQQVADEQSIITCQVVNDLVNKVCAINDEDNSTCNVTESNNGNSNNDLLFPELQDTIYKDLPNDVLNDKTLHDIWNNYDNGDDNDGDTATINTSEFVSEDVKHHSLVTQGDVLTIKQRNCVKSEAHSNTRKPHMLLYDVMAQETCVLDGTKAVTKMYNKLNNNKYLRDKNDFGENFCSKRNHRVTSVATVMANTLDDIFYDELDSRFTKRKINVENSTSIARKKLCENDFATSLTSEAMKLGNSVVDYYPPYENLLQLDGMVDIYNDEEPVKCVQCRRTYRTTLSFERHLETCNADFSDYTISSGESDCASGEEEKLTFCDDSGIKATMFDPVVVSPLPTKHSASSYITKNTLSTEYANIVQNKKLTTPTANLSKPYETDTGASIDLNSVCQYTAATYEDVHFIKNNMQSAMNFQTMLHNMKQESAAVASPSVAIPVTATIEPATIELNFVNSKMPSVTLTCSDYTINTPNQCTLSNISETQAFDIQNMVATPVATPAPAAVVTATAPTYILQSFPKTEIVPTYVTIDSPSINGCMHTTDTSYLSQPLQLQQVATMNQPTHTLSFQPMVSTILGTIVQPNVIETPTYIVDTSGNPAATTAMPSAELFTVPQANIILPSQPMFTFGMETAVVSNTVMSSSQFMAQSPTGNVGGASALYSTTTTQVFQAGKQLPQSDFSSGFIVLNSTPVASTHTTLQPLQQTTLQPVNHVQQISPSTLQPSSSLNSGKYVYVQINEMPKVKKQKPIIIKSAKQNVATKKPVKVMKVKNNRPVAIQTKDNTIPILTNSRSTCTDFSLYSRINTKDMSTRDDDTNVKHLKIKTTDKASVCKHNVEDCDNGEINLNGQTNVSQVPNKVVVIDNQYCVSKITKNMECSGHNNGKVYEQPELEQPNINSSVQQTNTSRVPITKTNKLPHQQELKKPQQTQSFIKNARVTTSIASCNSLTEAFRSANDIARTPHFKNDAVEPEATPLSSNCKLNSIINCQFSSNEIRRENRTSLAQFTDLRSPLSSQSYLTVASVNDCIPGNHIIDAMTAKQLTASQNNITNGMKSKSENLIKYVNSSHGKMNSHITFNDKTERKQFLSTPHIKSTILSASVPSETEKIFDELLKQHNEQYARTNSKLKQESSVLSKESPSLPFLSVKENNAQPPFTINSSDVFMEQDAEMQYSTRITDINTNHVKFVSKATDATFPEASNKVTGYSEDVIKPPVSLTLMNKNKYVPHINQQHKCSFEDKISHNGFQNSKTNADIVKKKKCPEKENNIEKLKNQLSESAASTSTSATASATTAAVTTSDRKSWKTASISYEVNAEDGFSYKTNNLLDLWNKILESVQKSRIKYKLPLLPKNASVNAESVYRLLGFENNASKYLLEQLPDAWKCIFYKPIFHKSAIQNGKISPVVNESGCARTEPFTSSHKYDMFGWLASRHRKPPKFMMISDSDIVNGNRRVASLNLPMAMRFRHLKETAKETVGVFRSDIHGRGLFCLRDIDAGEMVIEYAGEVIRSMLTDKRERCYTSKGIGCYMFRIDDKYVVDATMCGNAARFINHSCEPNCYSRIVDILGKKHILIFALRRIPKGEELTYDYKFPLEDEKIYCHCLSRKCRKYLN